MKQSSPVRISSRLVFLAFFLLSSLATACGRASGSGAEESLEPIDIVIAPYFSYSPLYIGQQAGVFAAEGLELQIVDVQRSSDALVGLAEGRIDVVPGTLFPGHFNAIGRGARIRMVAGTTFLDPEGCVDRSIIIRSDFLESSGELTQAHLAQAVVSANPASLSGFTIEKALEPYDLSLDDVEIVDIPSSAELDAFSQGSLDLTLASEPWLTRLLEGGAAEHWVAASELLPGAQTALMFYGPSLLDENTELGARFLRAYLRAVQIYQEGKTGQNVDTLAGAFELEPELIESICWPSFQEDGTPNLQSIQEFQSWSFDQGQLDQVIPPNDYWEPGPLEAARGE